MSVHIEITLTALVAIFVRQFKTEPYTNPTVMHSAKRHKMNTFANDGNGRESVLLCRLIIFIARILLRKEICLASNRIYGSLVTRMRMTRLMIPMFLYTTAIKIRDGLKVCLSSYGILLFNRLMETN